MRASPVRVSMTVPVPVPDISSLAFLCALTLTVGCTEQHAAPTARSATTSSSTSASSTSTEPTAAAPAAVPTTAAALPPAAIAAAAPSSASPSASDVKVVTSGMHVGGGPYDDVTKGPIKRSVEPHFEKLARCWKHVERPQQAYFGVDLVIDADGGKALVSNPRTTLKGGGFVPCVVAFYEGVVFEKPKNGKTVVSYSVQFTPTARP